MKKMKLLPSAVLVANLLLCAVCQAQSNTIKFDTSYTLRYYQPKLPETDTIKEVLLLSDSSNIPTIIKGYSVRKKYNRNMDSNGDWSCWNCKDYMLHSYYLDDKKKPISPTVIVWQSVSAK